MDLCFTDVYSSLLLLLNRQRVKPHQNIASHLPDASVNNSVKCLRSNSGCGRNLCPVPRVRNVSGIHLVFYPLLSGVTLLVKEAKVGS